MEHQTGWSVHFLPPFQFFSSLSLGGGGHLFWQKLFIFSWLVTLTRTIFMLPANWSTKWIHKMKHFVCMSVFRESFALCFNRLASSQFYSNRANRSNTCVLWHLSFTGTLLQSMITVETLMKDNPKRKPSRGGLKGRRSGLWWWADFLEHMKSKPWEKLPEIASREGGLSSDEGGLSSEILLY